MTKKNDETNTIETESSEEVALQADVVTVNDIRELQSALVDVGKLRLATKLAYRLAYNRRVADQILKIADFRQTEIIDEFGQKDKEGNIVRVSLPNGLERVEFGKNKREAERRIRSVGQELAPMEDFRRLSMADLDAIEEAAPEGFALAEVVYGLYPIIKGG